VDPADVHQELLSVLARLEGDARERRHRVILL
jgi:hypothetical protein